ncbi:unnamed protein product [Clonostachys rosea]|uniref:Uncharacterized protein n=1 Tax=Bionectria ochroleuca TaxID=29856 RepID=A0ABY6UMS2_BIOOC|nr:unnamed protein product [Clonostachys rosea]
MEVVHAHKEKKAYTRERGKGSALIYKLDDTTAYNISEAEETQLWEIEVDRLIGVFKDIESPAALSECAIDFPEPTTEKAFDNLSELADQLLINLHVCRVDNGSLLHGLSKANHNDSEYASSFTILSERQTAYNKSAPANTTNTNRAQYCSLVDMATAVCCRIALTSFEEKNWQNLILSSLAKYSAKLKVLSMDPHKFFKKSIDMASRCVKYKDVIETFQAYVREMRDNNAEDWEKEQRDTKRKRNEQMIADDDGMYLNFARESGGRLNFAQLKELEAFAKKAVVDEDASYFANMNLANGWTSSSLMHIMQELKASFVSDLPSDCLDICSVVYEAGTVDCPVPIILHQDRGAELSGTNDLSLVHYSYMGFWLASKAAKGLREAHKSEPRSSSALFNVRVKLQNEEELESTPESVDLCLRSLSEGLQIIVPLLCTSPLFVEILKTSIKNLVGLFSIDAEEDFLLKVPRFTSILSFRNPKYESKDAGCLPRSDFKSLSRSILAEKDRHATLALRHTPTLDWDKVSALQRQQQVEDLKARRTQLAIDASEWIIEETVIHVNCPHYVYTVVGVCTAIAVGGLMLGIFLGTFIKDSGIALKGVDPFGFTSYSWIIAAFVMLIAKSIRVVEWPWRDFLLRRVTCRSLSELHSVTGVDEQDLLTYLITMEYENVLVTKGPFNSIFTRRKAEGFSIDCKPEVRTLLASGLILIKVLSSKEPALVCLDLRAGTKNGRVSIWHKGSRCEDQIFCRYPPNKGDRVQDVVLNQQQRHWDRMNGSWNKILGIYHDWDRKLRI